MLSTYANLQKNKQNNGPLEKTDDDLNYLEKFHALLSKFRNSEMHDYSQVKDQNALICGINDIQKHIQTDEKFITAYVNKYLGGNISARAAGNNLCLLRIFIMCTQASMVVLLLEMGARIEYDTFGFSPLNVLGDIFDLNLSDAKIYEDVKKIIKLFHERNFDFTKVIYRKEIVPTSAREHFPNAPESYEVSYNMIEVMGSRQKNSIKQMLDELKIEVGKSSSIEDDIDSMNDISSMCGTNTI